MSAPHYTVRDVTLGERPVHLALPFRFGDTTVTDTAEAYARITLEGPRGAVTGVSAQLMVPRWFDKRAARTNPQTVDDLRRSARAAARLAPGLSGTARAIGLELRAGVLAALPPDLPPLAGGFGPALLEMALADAVCRDQGLAFPDAARVDAFGLADHAPPDLAPDTLRRALAGLQPASSILVRHTVGYDAPLTPGEVSEGAPDDRPVALTDVIAQTGIRAFKIKLKGDPDADIARLAAIAPHIDALPELRVTVDANEQYEAQAFAAFLDGLHKAPALDTLRAAILYYEQPFPRETALSERLDLGVPLVIDEADDADDAFPRALACGWSGVSVKSCKGVFRALLNHARVAAATTEGRTAILSAEDLTCQPGLCWQQDTTMAATVGATHVERNGHHFAGGFQGAPEAERAGYLAAHPDLYAGTAQAPRLRIEDGRVATGSLFAPGFASDPGPDFDQMADMKTPQETNP